MWYFGCDGKRPSRGCKFLWSRAVKEIGRVYYSISQAAWLWHSSCDDGGPVEQQRNGWHADKIQACKAMEQAYDELASRARIR